MEINMETGVEVHTNQIQDVLKLFQYAKPRVKKSIKLFWNNDKIEKLSYLSTFLYCPKCSRHYQQVDFTLTNQHGIEYKQKYFYKV